MHSRMDGIRVRIVSRTMMVQGIEPFPTPVMRISFGSGGAIAEGAVATVLLAASEEIALAEETGSLSGVDVCEKTAPPLSNSSDSAKTLKHRDLSFMFDSRSVPGPSGIRRQSRAAAPDELRSTPNWKSLRRETAGRRLLRLR